MTLNREKLAECLGVSLPTVDALYRQGMPGEPPKRKGDQWRFESSACVNWLRERERTAALGEVAQIDEGEAKRRKLAAEAALAELNLAKAQGEVVAISDFGDAGSQMIGAARAKLLGLGAKLGRQVAVIDDPAECAALVDDAIGEALQELSEFEPQIQIDGDGDPEPDPGIPEGAEAVGATSGSDHKRVGGRRTASQQRKQR